MSEAAAVQHVVARGLFLDDGLSSALGVSWTSSCCCR